LLTCICSTLYTWHHQLYYFGFTGKLVSDDDNTLLGGAAGPRWNDVLIVSVWITAASTILAGATAHVSSKFDSKLLKGDLEKSMDAALGADETKPALKATPQPSTADEHAAGGGSLL
jgi:hypothetical protein